LGAVFGGFNFGSFKTAFFGTLMTWLDISIAPRAWNFRLVFLVPVLVVTFLLDG